MKIYNNYMHIKNQSHFKLDKYVFESVIINVIFFILYVFIFSIKFETNDDETMMQIVSGLYGEYEPHMVFINYLMGMILAFLYKTFPGIQWYVVLMLFFLLVSFTVLSLLCYKRNNSMGRVFSIVILLLYGYYFYTSIQFTEVAGILGTAGILLLWDVWYDYKYSSLKGKTFRIVISILLIIFGSLYRFHSVVLVYAISFLYAASLLKKNEMMLAIKLVFISLVIMGMSFTLYKLDRFFYNDKEWEYYTEYNVYRSKLMDYKVPNYQDNRKLYDELQLNEDDIEYIKKWNLNDKKVLGLEQFKQISSLNDKLLNKDDFVKSFFKTIFNGVLEYKWIGGYILSILFVMLLCNKSISLRIVLLQIVGLTLVESYFYIMGRFLLSRVDICIFFAASMINFLLAIEYNNKDIKLTWKSCLLVVIMAALSFGNAEIDNIDSGYNNEYESIIVDKKHLYIFPTIGIDIGTINVWEVLPPGALSNIAHTGGWTTFAPFRDDAVKAYGVNNIFSDCVNNDAVYFVSSKSDEQIVDFLAYIKRHYNNNAYPVLVESGEKMNIYKIKSSY